jgi:DNA-binding transcriptional ArsR family regulator
MEKDDKTTQGEENGEPDYDQLAREVGGRETVKVLDRLTREDYIYNIARDFSKAHQTIVYHIRKLQDRGLIQETGEAEGRTYYKITEKGRIVLEKLNVPD